VAHSVLLVPVPAVEALVLPYIPSEYRRSDGGTHAHVTVLGPFLPLHEVLDRQQELSDLLRAAPPFEITWAHVGIFDGGIVHLRPEDDSELRRLLSLVQERFPHVLPYGGAFPQVEFHLTVGYIPDDAQRTDVVAQAERVLPVSCRVEHLEVLWYEPGATRGIAAFHLGGGQRNHIR
jgi:hypothetical protein